MPKVSLLLLLLAYIAFVLSEDPGFFAKFHQNDYKVTYERSDLEWYNKSFYRDFKIVTFKYNRTQAVSNFTYTFRFDMGYDLQYVVQVYKFLSNEFRPFPIRIQSSYCFAVENNIAGFGAAHNRENPACPLRKNVQYRFTNFYPDESQLPPLMPIGRYKMETNALYKDNHISTSNTIVSIHRPILYNN